MPEGTKTATGQKPTLVMCGIVEKAQEDANVIEMGKDKSGSRCLNESHAVKIIYE